MKKLDIFIIKKFVTTFLFMIGVFVIIAVVFDVSENIDDFLKSEATFWEVVIKYYINFCFYFGNLLSAFIIFLSVIWFTSKMAQQSEFIAMLSGGVPYTRIMRPYLVFASLMVLVSLVLGHWIVPMANQIKYDFELQYIRKHLNVSESNVHQEVAPGVLAYFHRVNVNTHSGSQFSIEYWDQQRLIKKITAPGATYFPDKDSWRVERAVMRTYLPDGGERVKFYPALDTILPLKMENFTVRAEVMGAMTTSRLYDFLDELMMNGSSRVVDARVELYSRTANPFSILILTVIGLVIASRRARGGTGVHLLLAVVIGFTFIFISKIAAVAALNIGLPVLLAVWLPNIVFCVLAFFLFKRAQR